MAFSAPAFAQDSRAEYARATRGFQKPAVLRWGERRPETWKDYSVQQATAIEPFEDEGASVIPAAVSASEKGKVIHAIDIWQDGEPRNRVQLVGGASPLEDPFEDLPAEPLASDPVPPGEVEIIEQPGEVEAEPDPAAEPMPLDPDPPATVPPATAPPANLPTPNPTRKSAADADCARRFNNNRDCCREGENCKKERQRLLAPSIREISLDITPKFDIDDEMTSEQVAADRVKRLSPAPSRVWKNIAGDTLVEGKLANLVNGRVVVTGPGGETLAEIPLGELGEEELCFVSAWWRLPTECLLIDEPTWLARTWVPSTFTWKASGLCHKPLYFEHPGLERYGHTTGPIAEPFVSAAHFFVNIALVPYHMGISPPNECEYALGYYRPGSCAPWLLPPFPISLRGALYQAAAVTGAAYFIP